MRPLLVGSLVAALCLTSAAEARRPSAATSRPRQRQRQRLARVVRAAMPSLTQGEAAWRVGIFLGGVIRTAIDARRASRDEWNPFTGRVQAVRLSPAEEVVLGEAMAPVAIRQNGGLVADPVLQSYVASVGQRVVTRNGLGLTPYRFRFGVLASETPNAFAAPGGRIFITVGLLRRMANEAELAMILGHEAGHVVARHGSERLVQEQIGTGVLDAAGQAVGGLPARPQLAIAARDLNRILLGYSREHEHEADRLGVRFQQGAGYDASGLHHFTHLLGHLDTGTPEIDSDHPSAVSRVTHIALDIARAGRGERGAERYLTYVLARL